MGRRLNVGVYDLYWTTLGGGGTRAGVFRAPLAGGVAERLYTADDAQVTGYLTTAGEYVFFGMLGVTFFGLVLTPVFYVVLQGMEERRTQRARQFAIQPAHDEESKHV